MVPEPITVDEGETQPVEEQGESMETEEGMGMQHQMENDVDQATEHEGASDSKLLD